MSMVEGRCSPGAGSVTEAVAGAEGSEAAAVGDCAAGVGTGTSVVGGAGRCDAGVISTPGAVAPGSMTSHAAPASDTSTSRLRVMR